MRYKTRHIPFRDLHGYVIKEEDKPIFDESRTNISGGYRRAVLIECPQINGLKWIGHCLNCKWFIEIERFKGVKCKFKEITPKTIKQNESKTSKRTGRRTAAISVKPKRATDKNEPPVRLAKRGRPRKR